MDAKAPQVADVPTRGATGLTSADVAARLKRDGRNELRDDPIHLPLTVFAEQFRSPFVLILLAAAGLSLVIGEMQEALIITSIVLASSLLGFFQEYRAANTVAALRARLRSTALVIRDGHPIEIQTGELVVGDVVLLKAGSMVPADGIALEANSLHVDEAPLTGESFPAEKRAGVGSVPSPDSLLHMGTSVRSGTGRMLITATGAATQYGMIAQHARGIEPETSFARGVRRFGLLMTQTMVVIVLVILPVNLLLGRPVVDSVLFAAALAVGLTPELLPAIVTVTLSRGARQLAAARVMVRRLIAIENIGAMDVLCTDKTGTLTEGVLRVAESVDSADGSIVQRWARINAQYQSGLDNPLDQALLDGTPALSGPVRKIAELPYDFERKCLSVAVVVAEGNFLVCKGAVAQILARCTHSLLDGRLEPLDAARLLSEQQRLQHWSSQGIRAIAVATKPLSTDAQTVGPADEADLTLVGYVLFEDKVKEGVDQIVRQLRENGVRLKLVSGDNRYVAAYVADAIGLSGRNVITGDQLARMNRRALARRLGNTDVFAEVTPDQKERVIEAYRRAGKVVGYLGDGINDAPALRAADLGVSVDNAVAAAREAADVVLLERNLHVLLNGILIGRASFANTLKYVRITTSANLGNMISMALASMFLPFLPLLAKQILINNFLSDLPMLAVSTDRVDPSVLRQPGRWNFNDLMHSMLAFGGVSSLFDLLTFALLLKLVGERPAAFQTGWFLESLLTQIAIIFVMRTRLPALTSQPSRWLIGFSIGAALCGTALAMLPIGNPAGFEPLSPGLLIMVLGIVLLYGVVSELLKNRLWTHRVQGTPAPLRSDVPPARP